MRARAVVALRAHESRIVFALVIGVGHARADVAGAVFVREPVDAGCHVMEVRADGPLRAVRRPRAEFKQSQSRRGRHNGYE